MGYPTLNDYQEALQHPATAFADRDLATGKIKKTGLGLPLALCGGFALTYTVDSGKKFAARCFHKESKNLETRYAAISSSLRNLNSKYFVDFEFQPQGVRIKGAVFPVVKMAWAPGVTLGEFLELNHSNKSSLNNLGASIIELAQFIELHDIAHGDIQSGNLMVADEGRTLRLIDYDGMFVPAIEKLGSAELGHVDFQHPKRTKNNYNSTLDRFSLISISISIKALLISPNLWDETQSDSDRFIFRGGDFNDPSNSDIFKKLKKIQQINTEVKNFESICLAEFNQIPSFSEFQNGINIPVVKRHQPDQTKAKSTQTTTTYSGQYPTVNASDFNGFKNFIGQVVELIGQISEVTRGKTRYGKPYVFINFGDWHGNCVKINIWNEGLSKGGESPTASWVGKWISVVGLVEPIYHSAKHNYNHISITINSTNLIHSISLEEAKFRLAGSRREPQPSSRSNRDLFDEIQHPSGTAPKPTTRSPHWQSPPSPGAQAYRSPTAQTARQIPKKGMPGWGWLLLLIGGLFLLKSCSEPSRPAKAYGPNTQTWKQPTPYIPPALPPIEIPKPPQAPKDHPAPTRSTANNIQIPSNPTPQIDTPARPSESHQKSKIQGTPVELPTSQTARSSTWDPRNSTRRQIKTRFGREAPESMSSSEMMDLENRLSLQRQLRTRFRREVPETMSFSEMMDLENRLSLQQQLRTRFRREVPETMSFSEMMDLENRLSLQQQLRTRFRREVPETMSFSEMMDLENRLSLQQQLRTRFRREVPETMSFSEMMDLENRLSSQSH